jgi:dephospho-CoA kinase
MKVIGITGGIGSGKSKVLYYLKEKYDAYIVEADKLAKSLMLPGGPVYKKLVVCFPSVVKEKDGPIDSKTLAGIVYSDKKLLEKLNSIVHPAVKEYILQDIDKKAADNDCQLYIIEAALLIEDGYKNICDEMWYVRTDMDVRIKRLEEFRGMDSESAKAVIMNQKPEDYYTEHSDFIIDNSGEFKSTEEQINQKLGTLN